MNRKLINLLAGFIFFAAACNDDEQQAEHKDHNTNQSTEQHVSGDDKNVKSVAITFSNIDPQLAASLQEVVDHYIHIKNGLADDNSVEAAKGAKAMERALKSIDKSLFTAGQKKIYDDNEPELKEHTEHISKNGDNIKHQRGHFSLLSEVVYDIVRSFGGGRPLYHDHCPMFNEDKGGAMWLSETKEVRNPYFGSEMPKCGTVEEIIQ